MYDNRFGRFTAVDPLLASGKSTNPQTFNRYIYISNNPVVLSDPTGLDPWWKGFCQSNGYCTYKESKDKPIDAEGSDGKWEQVNFGNSYYTTVADWGNTGRTAYLYASGGQDFGEGVARVKSFGDYFNPYSEIDPKQVAARNEQVRDAATDVIGGFSAFTINSVSDTYNFGAGAINWATGNEQLSDAWRYTPERTGERIFYYGANTALIGRSGLALYNGIQTIRSGGLSFRAFKATQGAGEVLGYVPAVTRNGKPINYLIQTEQSHMFISQATQRAYNLPNWLVNNRINVWKLNTIQHALIDPQRFKFLPKSLKLEVGLSPFSKYNLFTRKF